MLTKERPAVVQEQRQSEFICSACGASRDCDCNAPAVERLAAKQEQDRQRSKSYRERKTASRDAPVTSLLGVCGEIIEFPHTISRLP